MPVAGPHKNGTGGEATGLGGYIDRLSAAGKQFFVVCPEDAALAVRVAEAGGIAVYRKNEWSGEPSYHLTPKNAAVERWHNIRQLMPGEMSDKVWIQYTIEPDKERAAWVLEFAYHLSVMANADGYKVCAPNWSTGTPEPDAWESEGGLMFLRYAAENPDRCAVGLHEYSLNASDITEGAPWLVGRYQFMLDVCDDNGIAHPTILITEWGWTYNDCPDPDQAMADVVWAADQYGDIPFAAWTLGTWEQGPELPGKLAPIVTPMTEYMLVRGAPVESEEPMDWRDEVWEDSKREQHERGVEFNVKHTLQGMIFARPGYFPATRETTKVASDGNAYGYMVGEHRDKTEPRLVLAFKRPWPGPAGVKVLTESKQKPLIDDIVDDLPTHDTKRYSTRGVADIEHITIHHSATPTTTTPETIARYHVLSKDWPGIAYAFLVYSDGTIYQTNRLETISFHDTKNADSLGVCMVGNFSSEQPTQGALLATRELVDWLRGQLPGVTVRPHNAVAATGCPGSSWRDWWAIVTGEDEAPPFRFRAWPTDYRVVTQRFGARPEYYKQFGLPGHEGIDIRALHGTGVYAVEDGAAYLVTGNSGNYGIQVRLQHVDGYKTVYAHMTEALIDVGQTVKAGERIGRADSTGNTDGSHLHLTLKRDGESAPGYPSNIIDPTPFIEPFNPTWPGETVPPSPPTVDLLPYLRPNDTGPLYELRRQDGSQERVQTRVQAPVWFYTKGTGGIDGKSEWEELTADDDWILRGVDTSPGNGLFYELRDDPDRPWSRWAPRRMAVGETYSRAPWVIFRRKDNCNETLRGQHLTTLKVEAVHDTWTSPYNDSITLEGVLQVGVFHASGAFFERYFYARGYGLVGFVGEAVTSYISESHQPGARPDNQREDIPCL